MGNMRFKAGDRVRIKSLDWYNENKDINDNVHCGDKVFDNYMSVFCGSVVTICGVYPYNAYAIREDMYCRAWTDEMIEGCVESIEDRMKELRKMCTISLNNSNYTDKVEVLLNDYEYTEENGKAYFVKKKKEYPKTYEECSLINGAEDRIPLRIIGEFTRLINARNAYWKIAGEEMGLGKPWEPSDSDYITGRYCIFVHKGNIICDTPAQDCVLTFPTEEMRDAFYENFKEKIEECKELL